MGTLLSPTTPLVGFTSSSALLPQDRLLGSATTKGLLSTTIGVGLTAAVLRGRTSGGVVVIASGPSWTTVGVVGRTSVGEGAGVMELVINLDADVVIVARGRVVGLDREVLVDEELEVFAAGFVGLDSCPKSLVSSGVIAKRRE